MVLAPAGWRLALLVMIGTMLVMTRLKPGFYRADLAQRLPGWWSWRH